MRVLLHKLSTRGTDYTCAESWGFYMNRIKGALFVVIAVTALHAQEKPGTFPISVSGADASLPVAEALINKMKVSKPFEPVSSKDDSKAVVVITCMDRKQADPFVCMYVLSYKGAAFNSPLGAGVWVAASADNVATAFLASMAQDIVERWDDTDKENLKKSLEACLLLTDLKCNVPDPLQKELNAKQLTLGQYLMKKSR